MHKKMVSMKLSAKDRTREGPALTTSSEVYPYGLTLQLDNAVLKKLKLEELPEVGDSYMIMGTVTVSSVSSHDSSDGPSRSVSLQITKLCLHDEDEMDDKVEAMYGEAD